jgi:hypothetical protein
MHFFYDKLDLQIIVDFFISRPDGGGGVKSPK